MREQAIRMLSAVDLGEPHWSMDTGGFLGHPSPENYARWMEFAAFVPIMRVHGTYGEKRQPWVYGAQAEADAKAAINLRYRLIPYLYSCEWSAHESGVGIVRPLVWDFPNDDNVPWQTDEWMVGDALLVAPIFGEGQAHRSIYLPKGSWFDYNRGDRYDGARTIVYDVDPNTWADIPLFVRSGSILASQDVEQYVGQRPVTTVYLDVFPAKDLASFDYYDDDGETYDYEKGVYYEQHISAVSDVSGVRVELGTPRGTYRPALQRYQVRLHGISARSVTVDGSPSRAWSTGKDRFGPVTTITVDARTVRSIVGSR
jgi:alpha-glucosidase